MNRSLILVAVVTGSVGLAAGWVASGQRGTTATPSEYHSVKKPPASPARKEFELGTDDVANDRETPALAVDARGHVVLAWAKQSGANERTIYLARSADGGRTFDMPAPFRKVPIYKYTSKGKNGAVTYSTHVLPRLVATGDGIDLGWVEASKEGPPVHYYVARSVDGGKTFGEPISAHSDSAVKPGFTTLSASPDGTLLASWIDARNRAQQPFFSAKGAGSEVFEAERMVFAGPDSKGICPCCDLAAARLPDGSDVVAFRNSDSGHRDIWLAHAPRGGEFGPPKPLTADRWKFEGCPHDGPSLVLNSDRLNAAWMSAHSGRNRVYVASSPVGALAFESRELSPGTPGAQGHPRLVAAPTGALFAVWDESLDPAATATPKHEHGHKAAMTGLGRVVMIAAAGDGQSGFGVAEPIAPRDGAFQLNPALAVAPDGAVLVAWSEIDTAGKRVVFVRRDPARETK
jgi:hypothetical protein